MSVRILLVDDHLAFREGMKDIIEGLDETFKVVGMAENGMVALRSAVVYKPDVILMDIDMPVMDGIAATKAVLQPLPNTGVIGFSMSTERWKIKEMIAAGAKGYLVKNTDSEELIAAIKSVYEGKPFYCEEVKRIVEKINEQPNTPID
ncbi:MAG TPA: response regulator transcription factor [Flavisolibacter sp.]|nr:response regulator transcription factor [Flavisolibacter sp.]